jgi:hypothetical protein
MEPRAYQHVAERCFPQSQIRFLAAQGGCSATFLVAGRDAESKSHAADSIVQFREARFALNLDISAAAVETYKKLAPPTRQIHISQFQRSGEGNCRVVCYEMEIISGVPYSSIIPKRPDLTVLELERQVRLVEGFADFILQAWPAQDGAEQLCDGKVGCQIPQKLRILARQLPSANLRAAAKRALENLEQLQRLPIVLNHGDLIPSNMMVEAESGTLNGMVDWAEAEYLPFGTCLYGVEYLFGYMPDKDRRDSVIGERHFQYYSCATDLRRLFWRKLRSKLTIPHGNEELLEAVLLAKLIGTLLWYGFAWDDGAIDRVVNAERDGQELAYLETFICDGLDQAVLL